MALAQVIPGLSEEGRFGFSLLGGLIGAVAAYALLWWFRQAMQPPPKPKPKPPSRPQVVGATCATCEERILMITDGADCPQCGRIYCVKCQPKMPCTNCNEIVDAEVVGPSR